MKEREDRTVLVETRQAAAAVNIENRGQHQNHALPDHRLQALLRRVFDWSPWLSGGHGTVLMLGYMNRDALVATLAQRRVIFFSRSKGRLWAKGERSGDALEVEQLHTDRDRDTLLVSAWPHGPVCHSGSGSCFGDPMAETGKGTNLLATLEEVIRQRLEVRTPGSYTAKLLDAGWQRIAQKVGEEGIEVALAAAGGSDHEVVSEVADLFYHVLVLLKGRGLSLEQVLKELESRHVAQAALAGSAAR